MKRGDFTVAAHGLADKCVHAEKCEKFLSVLPHRHKALGEKIEFSPRKVFRTCILFLKREAFSSLHERDESKMHSQDLHRSGP